MIKVNSTLDVRNLNKLLSSFEKDVIRAVDKAALMCVTSAQENAPVDSGALKNSIHAKTSKTDGSTLAIASANALNPKADAQTDQSELKKYESKAISGVAYSPMQEFGANGLQGRYYMTKAATETAPKYFASLKKIADGEKP